MFTITDLNPTAAAKLRKLAEWLAPCNHSDLQLGQGNCSTCYGGIEYCPCGAIEIQSHEANCPEAFKADGRLLGTLSMRFFAIEDRKVGFYAGLGERYGIEFVPAPHGGMFSLVEAETGLTEEGKRWLGCLAEL